MTEQTAVRQELCRVAWSDGPGKESHVCREDKGHPPPHKCSSCGAERNG